MITTKLIGGLGNQMFQYAAGLALAQHHQVPLCLDISAFSTYTPYNTRRSYALNAFCVDVRHFVTTPWSMSPLKKLQRHWNRVWAKLSRFTKLNSSLSNVQFYQEPSFHFDSAFWTLPATCVLQGYFQSPLYFQPATNTVQEHFRLKAPLSAATVEYREVITKSPCAVSIHIRRGDYLSARSISFHGILPITYYRQAVRLMGALHGPDCHFFVFSDDPDYAVQYLDFLPHRTIVSAPSKIPPHEDMYLMSQCHHHIIANSSYSWWGAWLNFHEEKTVIAPKQWFAPKILREKNTCDLYLKHWILL